MWSVPFPTGRLGGKLVSIIEPMLSPTDRWLFLVPIFEHSLLPYPRRESIVPRFAHVLLSLNVPYRRLFSWLSKYFH